MEYFIHLAIICSLYVMLALCLDLIVGYTGLLSVSHAAFYGIGAYATAILLTRFEWGFFSSMGVGMVAAALVSGVLGLVLSRFKDDYYALASMGLNFIAFSIFLNWQSVTRGPLGIPGIARPSLFGFTFSSNLSFLILALVFALLAYGLCLLIVRSSFGRVLKAIREDEQAIQVFGYNTLYFKLVIFVIGSAIAAAAGSLFAAYITFIDPSSFALGESIFMLAIVILGGLASQRGAVAGALFLVLLPEVLRFVGFPSDIAAQMRQVVYGVILVLLMLYRPKGLAGEYEL